MLRVETVKFVVYLSQVEEWQIEYSDDQLERENETFFEVDFRRRLYQMELRKTENEV
jgi:hypothetical protein